MSSVVRFLPAQLAHSLAPIGLKAMTCLKAEENFTWRPLNWKGLQFLNPLGVAGGVDKTGELVAVWKKWGAGFTEVGTVTPKPQLSNPGTTVLRDWNQKLLWNRLGFPSPGAEAVKETLKKYPRSQSFPLFVNIGKNRDTPLELAHNDYGSLAQDFSEIADAFVINVSSPNTQGLRQLQQSEFLTKILNTVKQSSHSKPCLLKLSPDLTLKELEDVLSVGRESRIDGFILTNTTIKRPSDSKFPTEGGLSGQFLDSISKDFLKNTLAILDSEKKNFLVVSSGGILSPDRVKERLDMGADLIQVYAALVFSGPQFFKETYGKFSQEVS